jgi:two-component system cell cycle sensor histidine kinase/response regulator CckA
MAGGIAHDFNNMLVSILGNAQLARDLLGPGHEVHELLDDVRDAAVRAAGLTRQLLAFSRGQVLARREVKLASVVDGVTSMLRSLMPANIELSVKHDAPCTVYADIGQLEQVVLNLVVNARDAIPSGGHIRVSTGMDGERAVLTVEDDGAGMSADVRAHLFEPFFTTKADTGTGLGLAVVDTVVRRHDGAITVDSEPGHGAVFRVRLPISHGRGEARTAEPPAVAEARARRHECVLVVDDDRQIRVYLERLLSRAGFRVIIAEDGRAALDELARAPDVSLVVTDLVMPHVGGIELRDELRARGAKVPVLLMTGYAPNAPDHDGELVLSKPFTPQELLAKVRAAIDAS